MRVPVATRPSRGPRSSGDRCASYRSRTEPVARRPRTRGATAATCGSPKWGSSSSSRASPGETSASRKNTTSAVVDRQPVFRAAPGPRERAMGEDRRSPPDGSAHRLRVHRAVVDHHDLGPPLGRPERVEIVEQGGEVVGVVPDGDDEGDRELRTAPRHGVGQAGVEESAGEGLTRPVGPDGVTGGELVGTPRLLARTGAAPGAESRRRGSCRCSCWSGAGYGSRDAVRYIPRTPRSRSSSWAPADGADYGAAVVRVTPGLRGTSRPQNPRCP